MRNLDVDVMLVNEAPKNPVVWKRRCVACADRWGLRMVTGGRPAGSNLILTAPSVVVESAASKRVRQPLFQPRRGIAWAQLRTGGRLFGVVSCHLSLDPRRRLHEATQVLAAAQRLRGPVIIGGDLNEPPSGPAWQRLRAGGFVDHGDRSWLTFPADEPTKRIDALLVRGAAQVIHHGHPGVSPALLARGSDHRPVVLEVEL
ncbi:endonuclease/exonuclease/phosphatase family protein [Nocardioides mesophilus]|nr:endonuclease/exonuclease/phosphatase family protein [Nocardioides mesophilus]